MGFIHNPKTGSRIVTMDSATFLKIQARRSQAEINNFAALKEKYQTNYYDRPPITSHSENLQPFRRNYPERGGDSRLPDISNIKDISELRQRLAAIDITPQSSPEFQTAENKQFPATRPALSLPATRSKPGLWSRIWNSGAGLVDKVVDYSVNLTKKTFGYFQDLFLTPDKKPARQYKFWKQ